LCAFREASIFRCRGNNAGTRYNFSTTTADAIQTGIFRFNSASVTTTTVIFIDVLDAGSVDMTTYLDSWNTSNSPTRKYWDRFRIQIRAQFIVYFNLIV
jgi:hypothetical protein